MRTKVFSIIGAVTIALIGFAGAAYFQSAGTNPQPITGSLYPNPLVDPQSTAAQPELQPASGIPVLNNGGSTIGQ